MHNLVISKTTDYIRILKNLYPNKLTNLSLYSTDVLRKKKDGCTRQYIYLVGER